MFSPPSSVYIAFVMDPNKRAELHRIGYTIPKTCGLCKHGVFVGKSDFGGCELRTYEHIKHSASHRQLSVFRGGSCPDKFEPSESALSTLGLWKEFLR